MTTIHPNPGETPAAIRAILAAANEPGLTDRFDDALDAAYAEARDTGSMQPLFATMRRWWFEAENWRDPVAHRARLVQWEKLALYGPPPPEQRIPWEQIRERHGL